MLSGVRKIVSALDAMRALDQYTIEAPSVCRAIS